jgi:hypothetical protein
MPGNRHFRFLGDPLDQEDIDHAVAAVTGESVLEINRRGFVLADLPEPDFDPEPSGRRPEFKHFDDFKAQL